MKEQSDHHKRMWEEMSERDRQINQRGLIAYEAAETNLNVKSLPGFEVDKTLLKDDFKHTSMNRLRVGGTTSIASPDVMSKKPMTTRNLSPTIDRIKASTLGRNPITGADNNILPEYSQRAKRVRSSVNYEDLGAGKRTQRSTYDVISHNERPEEDTAP